MNDRERYEHYSDRLSEYFLGQHTATQRAGGDPPRLYTSHASHLSFAQFIFFAALDHFKGIAASGPDAVTYDTIGDFSDNIDAFDDIHALNLEKDLDLSDFADELAHLYEDSDINRCRWAFVHDVLDEVI